MASKKETVAEIVREMRGKWGLCYFSEGTRRIDGGYSEIPSIDSEEVAYRIEAAHKREIEAKDAEIEKLRFDIMTLKSEQRTAGEVIIEQTNKVMAKDAEIEELTAIVNAECRKCGECAKFGKVCTAGDIDGAEDHGACEKFVSREDAEIEKLREYLKDAASLRCGECWFTAHEGKCPHSLDKDCVAITRRKIVASDVLTKNARLIAAAPDLYEASYGVVTYCEKNHLVPSEQFRPVLTRLRAALAKAAGEGGKNGGRDGK